MVDLSIGIVTYNSVNEIGNLLDSIYRYTDGISFSVYVVDNCSSDGTAEYVAQNYPQVMLIRSRENAGFGHGHNQAVRASDARYHAVVNPDIVLHGNVFAELTAFLDSHPDAVLATPKILNPDGTEQMVPKRLPTKKYMILGRLSKWVKPFQKYRDEYTRAGEQFSAPAEIAFCTGCFMVIRNTALKSCNGFDEQFFMYLEDADLSRRLSKYGKLYFCPEVSVEHRWEQASGKSLKFLMIHLDSMRKYMRKVRRVR